MAPSHEKFCLCVMCWDFLNIALKLFCKLHVWADSLLWQLTYKMLIDIHWNGVEPYFSKNGDSRRTVVFKGPHLYAFLYEEECKSNLKMSAKTSVFSRQSLRVKKMSTLLPSRKKQSRHLLLSSNFAGSLRKENQCHDSHTHSLKKFSKCEKNPF